MNLNTTAAPIPASSPATRTSRATVSGRVVLYQMLVMPNPTTIELYRTSVARAKARPGPIALVVLLAMDFTAPAAGSLKMIRDRTQGLLEPQDEVHIVIQGHGLWAKIQRSVFEGMVVFAGGKRSRISFSRTFEEGIEKACALTSDSKTDVLAAARAARMFDDTFVHE